MSSFLNIIGGTARMQARTLSAGLLLAVFLGLCTCSVSVGSADKAEEEEQRVCTSSLAVAANCLQNQQTNPAVSCTTAFLLALSFCE